MAVDLDAPNRAAFRAFGDKAQTGQGWTYTPAQGQPFDIDGIYDEAWAVLGIQAGIGGRGGIAPISTTKPALLLRIVDMPAGFKPKQKDCLRRKAKAQNYTISDTQPDGMGCIRLILTKTA